MIPQEKSAAVTQALRDAFGVADYDEITVITKGRTSSLVFRIVVQGTPYLLKIIVRAEDPTRHYTCMTAAAEAGLAARVLYTSIADKISITEFIDAEPFPISDALVRMPAVLRSLHALPPFARAPFNTTSTFLLSKGPMVDGFLQKFQASNILPKAESEEFFARHAELAAAYPWDDGEMVSSHNDLFKPDNILFDGRRVSLVDWEAAFLNDRYADLAVVANQIVANDEEEFQYLQEYFGTAPDQYQLARFHLMQQLTHLFYTMAFLFHGWSGEPIDWSEKAPDFRDFNRRMWMGEFDLAEKDKRIAFGKAHWDRLKHNVRQARYTDALRVVADRHAGSTRTAVNIQ